MEKKIEKMYTPLMELYTYMKKELSETKCPAERWRLSFLIKATDEFVEKLKVMVRI